MSEVHLIWYIFGMISRTPDRELVVLAILFTAATIILDMGRCQNQSSDGCNNSFPQDTEYFVTNERRDRQCNEPGSTQCDRYGIFMFPATHRQRN